MSNKMLIDAAHPEETRVVVLRGKKVEEFDFEAAERQQLRGNIYLAKVTRVEPSLQAAFVDYGGNRHGFLAFSEIHPDYYQIPIADRQALVEEQARAAAEDAAAENGDAEVGDAVDKAQSDAAPSDFDETPDSNKSDGNGATKESAAISGVEIAEKISQILHPEDADKNATQASNGESDDDADEELSESIEEVGADDALEEVPERRGIRARQYKIQEVIKRRQVLLVQVVKEERGNKGAALTTYLSLAGRYCVLMPNTARGGGISRKITNPGDRKRLKSIASDLQVADGAGVILRTAGASRTKAEIRRDFEYLLRLWENVRELTLKSAAPTLVYEEGSLIKRSIRDLYSKEIDEVLVSGDDGYREAKGFMRMLMPSHARHVHQYKDTVPLFARHEVENQLDAMFSPQVTLKSGGYIVINQTEALVAIDVNSGRATREHSIEDTAVRTNLEAAEEVSRQLRLRDLAGLIVIDFIDMEEKRNNRSVEKRLKECLKADRARIQVGRISHFGLLEMSRQRIRTGVLESSTENCPVCMGTGQVRSISSLALQILRSIEDKLLRDPSRNLEIHTRPEVAFYMLNQKRAHLADIENRFGLSIKVDGELSANGNGFAIEQGGKVDEPAETTVVDEGGQAASEPPDEPKDSEDKKRRKRRRRKRGGSTTESEIAAESGEEAATAESEAQNGAQGDEESGEQPRKRRRRGRRGGRRRTKTRLEGSESFASEEDAEQDTVSIPDSPDPELPAPAAENAEQIVEAPEDEATQSSATAENGEDASKTQVSTGSDPEPRDDGDKSPGESSLGETTQKKAGWWQRRSFL